MKIEFRCIGKIDESYVKEGIAAFTKRITNYFPAKWSIIPPPKNAAALSISDLKKKEGEIILGGLDKDDFLVLLDERGKQISSEGLAGFIQQCANESRKNIIFLIGGAFGVDKAVSERADMTWSLSSLVFPHQLVRLIISEQVYRACTIIRNEKYHHS